MIDVMDDHAAEAGIQHVISRLKKLGFDVHRSDGVNRTVLGAVGEQRDIDRRDIELF